MSLRNTFVFWYVILLVAFLGLRVILFPWIGPSYSGMLLFSAIFLIFFILFFRFVTKLTTRIKKNADVLERIGKGDLSVTANANINDEVGGVARGINEMVRQLKLREAERIERERKLEELKQDLEDRQLALINVLDDVTEEKELEHSRSESLLETVGEGIVMTDSDGIVTYANPAFLMMLGFGQDEIIGQDFAEFFKAYDLKDNLLKMSAMSSSAAITAADGESRVQLVTKSGNKVAVVINASPIRVHGEFRGVMRVFHDFSQDLALQKQKDDFFSIASHELRTPLTVISGNLDMIMSGMSDSKIGPEDREMLADTLSASDRLTRMVSDFLNVSRIDQGRIKLDLTEVDVCALAESVIGDMSHLANEKGLELRIKCPKEKVVLTADADKLKEVFINLIGNSLKFTREGYIAIDMIRNGKKLEVRVSDSGLGISIDKQALLFGRFQQAMDRTLAREAGGTGLGLYISREFVRLMGGEMKLEKSELKHGTTFLFTLPLSQ